MTRASAPRNIPHDRQERAALVGLFNSSSRQFDPEHSLDELAGLAAAAGATVVLRVLQERPKPDPATFLGSGKVVALAASWRTRSMRAGVLTSFTAAAMGALLSIAGAVVMLAIWHDPATLEEWRRTGGLDETFIDVPLKVIALGVAIGIAGAVIGKAAAKSRTTEILIP